MEEIKEQIKKDIDVYWENEIKKSFSLKINNYLEKSMNGIKNELNKIDNLFNDNIIELDKELNEIINKRILNKEDEELRKKILKFEELKNPPIVNLKFVQNTNPLINIILQSLSNINQIVLYYLNPEKEETILKKSIENPNKIYLGPSFLKLLDHLWKSNKIEYSPIEIHNILKKLMLNKYNTNNANIIITYILNKLHEEISFNQINGNNEEKKEDSYAHYDPNRIIRIFQHIFIKNKSFISETFFSTIKIQKKCLNCNIQPEYYFERWPVVNIYLEEKHDENFENYNKFSLEQHLKSLLNKDEERYIQDFCLICDSNQKKLVNKDIYSTSEVIIFNINREKDKNNAISFKYPETFNGKKIINNIIELPDYELKIVIKKYKNKNNNMEYISFYKNFIDNLWYWYFYKNDKIKLVPNECKKYIFDEKNTVVLIYTKLTK